MRLGQLKKLYHQNPNLIVQILSDSYSHYSIRAKLDHHYHILTGWFGRPLHFNSLDYAKQYLQQNTDIHTVYLVQSLPQDEVDPKKSNDHDLNRNEEMGIKMDLLHES